jgi:hypothetical protein
MPVDANKSPPWAFFSKRTVVMLCPTWKTDNTLFVPKYTQGTRHGGLHLQSQLHRTLRQEDHLSTVQGQSGQYNEISSQRKKYTGEKKINTPWYNKTTIEQLVRITCHHLNFKKYSD